MKIKSKTIFLICLLILSSLTMLATACPPPDCGDCKEWDPVQQKCVWKEGAECETSLDCKTCYYCMPTCTCELPYGSRCGEDDPCPGACHTCVGSEVCLCEDDDSKCASDECCDDGTCIKKCVDNAATCEWDMPDDYLVNCENFHPTDKSCEAIVLGQICNHRIVYRVGTAKCADCKPDCAKSRVEACAAIYPIRCMNKRVFLSLYCVCQDEDELPRYSGDAYNCIN